MTILVNDLTSYMEDYLEEMQVNGLTTQTLKNYQFAINTFIKYIQNEKKEIKTIDNTNIKRILKDYKKYRKNELNNKSSSINNYILRLLAFLNNPEVKVALGYDERDKIQVDLISEKKVLNKKPQDHIDEAEPVTYNENVKSLEQWEIQEILNTISDFHVRDRAIIQFMSRTGVRLSELVALNKTNIKARLDEKGLFKVPYGDKVIEVQLESYMVKGKTKARITYIDKATLRLLNDMIHDRITKTRRQHFCYCIIFL